MMSFKPTLLSCLLLVILPCVVLGRDCSKCASLPERKVCCKTVTGQLITRKNWCECKCEKGAKVARKGKCCPCSDKYDPVCCKMGNTGVGNTQNRCHCTHKHCFAGYVLNTGTCNQPSPCHKCDNKLKPVCCKMGKMMKTARNACQCTCKGGRVVTDEKCPSCMCDRKTQMICCKTPNGLFNMEVCKCNCLRGIVRQTCSMF